MKISEYGSISTLAGSDRFLTDGSDGTKVIKAADLAKALIPHMGNDAFFDLLDTYSAPEVHRTVFRGKSLGSSLTSAQQAVIQNGTFKGLWLGDYWTIGGVNWRIVDMNYWYNCGNTAFTKHHLVIMPDNALYNAQMNSTNTTEGGYVGSEMYQTNLNQAKTTVNSAFGSAVLTHRELLTNAVTNGRPSGIAWCDSTVELPNEIMMYGSHIFASDTDGTNVSYRHTINKQQLALFAAYPRFIVNRSYNQWLRDIVSSVYFAYVYYYGGADCYTASCSFGVRPVFAIG